MAVTSFPTVARGLRCRAGELRVGDRIEIEVPWTIALPAPHGNGPLSDHFTIEQCIILCEFLEQARLGDESRRCRLVDVAGREWFVDYFPSREDREGHLQWFDPARRRKLAG
jgi:hypothetical protein